MLSSDRTHAFGKWHLGMASFDHTPAGRGFDNSLIFFGGAQDHYSNCNCVDGCCAAPNNGFVSGHNRTPGAHCWRTIADPYTQKPAPWPSTALEMTGQGDTDLWANHGPAYGRNNTMYSGHLWTGGAVEAIRSNDNAAGVPLFMYIALPCNHSPLQVPQVSQNTPSSAQKIPLVCCAKLSRKFVWNLETFCPGN